MKKPLKLAWISGVSIFIIGMLSSIIYRILELVPNSLVIIRISAILFSILGLVALFYFYKGFIFLGEKYKSRLLVVSSILILFF